MKSKLLLLLLIASLWGCSPQNSAPGAGNKNLHKVLIDVSHGGKDHGGVSHGTKEKDLALQYAMTLKKELDKTNVDVLLSRSQDEQVTLAKRIKTANRASVDLVLSLHFNASANPEMSGFESYYKPDSEESFLMDRLVHQKMSVSNLVSDRGGKAADYSLLKNADAPAVLLELGYLSNQAELELLRKNETKIQYAKMLSEAIVDYFKAI